MELIEHGFHDSLQTFQILPHKQWIDIQLFLKFSRKKVKKTLKEVLKSLPGVKVQFILKADLKKYVYENDQTKTHVLSPVFNSSVILLLHSKDIDKVLKQSGEEIIANFHSFVCEGSGWLIERVNELLLYTYEYIPFLGGSQNHPRLPTFIQNKKSCICIPCHDDKCFIYSIFASMFPTRNPGRLSWYSENKKCWSSVDISNIHFPITINHIPQFEKDNHHISLNIFTYTKNLFPIYISSNTGKDVKYKINLLLHKKHYFLIKHLSRMIYGKHSYKNGRHRRYICHYCLVGFFSQKKYNFHQQFCHKKMQPKKTVDSNEKIYFKNYPKMVKNHFVIYWDTEVVIHKDSSCKTPRRDSHIPISVCCFRKCSDDNFTTPPKIFTGRDCIRRFLDHLEKEAIEINSILQYHCEKIRWTRENEIHFQNTSRCEMCGGSFTSLNKKCRDHFHINPSNESSESNARYVLCNRCNLTFAKQFSRIPVVAHCSQKYDLHFIVKELRKVKNIHIIPRNSEQFLSLALKDLNIIFIDSFQFLSSSLRNLADDLAKCHSYFMRSNFLKYITTDKKLQDLLLGKSFYPYEYATEDRLSESTLPEKEAFYDSLNKKHISEKDYEKTQKIWKNFHCKSLQEYMEMYMKLDTLLLAAVFEKYRATTFDHFKLDPVHYVSSPSLSYDAMLRVSGVKLDYLKDLDMYNFFQETIRGGITQTSNRYALANNIYLEDYKSYLPSSYIASYDINSLYAYCMTLRLPYKDFQWMTADELENIDISSLPKHGETGYFFEVCLEYGEHLHSFHNDLPLAPEKRMVSKDEWSPYMHRLASVLGIKPPKMPKLLLTLHNKHRYKIHYRTLQFYLKMGLTILKIHQGIKFKQKPWLKKFIEMNIAKRKSASNSFESNLYKLYNNSTFGRLCLNVFKQCQYKLVNDVEKFRSSVAKPTFRSAQVIRKDLVGIQFSKDVVLCNAPVYVGCSILENSKELFYGYFYCLLSKMYGKDLHLLYTDTDSYFVYIHQGKDIYNDLLLQPKYFDRSNFDKDSKYFDDTLRGTPGLLKDNFGGKILREFCALKPKVYSVLFNNEKSESKAKGVKKCLTEGYNIEEYISCLFDERIELCNYNSIRSKRHNLFTINETKISLSPWDDKRYWLSDACSSLAFGHRLIKRKSYFKSPLGKKKKLCCGYP